MRKRTNTKMHKHAARRRQQQQKPAGGREPASGSTQQAAHGSSTRLERQRNSIIHVTNGFEWGCKPSVATLRRQRKPFVVVLGTPGLRSNSSGTGRSLSKASRRLQSSAVSLPPQSPTTKKLGPWRLGQQQPMALLADALRYLSQSLHIHSAHPHSMYTRADNVPFQWIW